MMRAKSLTLLGVGLAGALVLIGGSQVWVSFMLVGVHSVEAVTGHDINPALSPLAIALVAAALALTIAGRVFRRVLGALIVLLGAGVIALAWRALSSPLEVVAGRITELTGIAGGADTNEVVWNQISAWAGASGAGGVLAIACGVVIALFSGGWGSAGRKYEGSAHDVETPAEGSPKPDRSADRISDWDALSEGSDPSEDFR